MLLASTVALRRRSLRMHGRQHRAGDNPAAGRQKVQSTPLAPCPIVRGSMPMHSATKHAVSVDAAAKIVTGTVATTEQADQDQITFAAPTPGTSASVEPGAHQRRGSHAPLCSAMIDGPGATATSRRRRDGADRRRRVDAGAFARRRDEHGML